MLFRVDLIYKDSHTETAVVALTAHSPLNASIYRSLAYNYGE